MQRTQNTPKYLLALLLLFCGWQGATAQSTVCEGSPVVLTLAGYTGSIQWEYSPVTLGNFGPLTGIVGDSAVVVPTLSGYYRAAVSNGTCNTFYSDTLYLSVLARPVADAGADRDRCAGALDSLGGAMPASGGAAPYTYAWSPATGLSSTSVGHPTFVAANSGTYQLTVTDANGCVGLDSVQVQVWALPVVDAGIDDSVNCGTDIQLSGSAAGANPFTYSWSPAGSLNNSAILNPVASPSGNTNYVLTAIDNNGCSTTDTVAITVLGASTGIDTFQFAGFIDTTFIVPACADTLTIQVWGAEGGFNTSSTIMPGLGAYQSGKFVLAPGTRIKILVGEKPSISGNGGGGGSFVTLMNNSPLIVAGGGGGSSGGTDSPDKHGQAGQNGGTGAAGGGLGGTAGNGGAIGSSGFQAGAGGGLLTNGADGWTASTGGKGFVNGGAGANVGFGIGGYGGGGNGSGYVVGGGGGGYSGGGSGGNSSSGVGGGGGSFNSGASAISTTGINSGNGRVIISW